MAENKNYGAANAKTGKGVRIYISADAEKPAEEGGWTLVKGLKSGTFPNPDIPEIEVTNCDSEVQETIRGLPTMQDLSLDFDYYPADVTHQMIAETVLYEDTNRYWRIVSKEKTYTFLGFLKGAPISFSPTEAMKMPLTLKVAAKPEITATDASV